MFLSLHSPLLRSAQSATRASAAVCALVVVITLSACGGGGSSSAADNSATTTPTGTTSTSTTPTGTSPTVGTPAGTTPSSNTSTNTTGPATQTTASPISTAPTGTSSVSETGSRTVSADTTPTAVYNSCADSVEASNPNNARRETYQRYILSGSKFGGDITQGITTAISLEGQGTNDFYYIKSAEVVNTMDGLPIPDTERVDATVGGPTGQSVSVYQIKNNQLGLAKEEQFDGSKPNAKLLYSNLYAPVFFDRLFTLTAGQEIIQTRVFTKQISQGDVFKTHGKAGNAVFHQAAGDTTYTISQRVKFLGVTQLVAGTGAKTYSTCKFQIQDTTSAEITTEWYLEGHGILVKSSTQVGSGAPIATQELETASDFGKTIFPRSN